MILDKKSTNRFMKLYTSFIAYAGNRLGMSDKHYSRYILPDGDEAFTIAQAVWDHSRSIYLIDDYVRDNPDKLSRTDLREIERWKCGLFGFYAVLRDGRDILFSTPGYAIAVRGLEREVDDYIEVDGPAYAETVLLPFDTMITFTCVVDSVQADDEELRLSGGLLDLEVVKATSRIIRSARDFVKYSDELHEAVLIDNADEEEDDLNYDLGPDDEVEGQHRGCLAGLHGRERLKAKAKMEENRKDETVADLFEEHVAEAPRRMQANSIEEIYTSATKRDLACFAKNIGIEGNVSSMGKPELLTRILPLVLPTTESALSIIRNHGLTTLRFVRELLKAGGRIELTKEDAIARGDIALPTPPVFSYYTDGERLIAYMMPEYLDCLSDVDWDEQEEATERVDKARDFFDAVAELRGVDVVDEVIEEYVAYVGPDQACDEDDLHNLLFNSGLNEGTSFVSIAIDDKDMLLNADLVDADSGAVSILDVRDIVRRQQDKPKHPVTPDMLEYSYTDWAAQVHEVQELIAYLDEHVPDAQDDLYFADALVDEVLTDSQTPDFIPIFSRYLRDYDFLVSAAQLERFGELITDALNHAPRWGHRGWTSPEMHQMTENGTWTSQKGD